MYAPRRAALLALCAIAVVLAASLFPATGLGTYPTDVWSGSPGGPPLFGTGEQQPLPQPDPPASEATPTPTETPEPANDANSDPPASSSGGGLSLVPLAALAGVLLIIGLLLNRAGYRREGFWLVHPNLPDIPPAFVQQLLSTIPRVTMGFVVGLSATLPRLFDDTTTVLGAAASAATMVVRGTVGGLAAALVAIPTLFTSGSSGLASGLGRALGALPGAVSSLGGQTSRDWSRNASTDTSATDADAVPADDDRGPLTVEEAWAAMTDRVPMHNGDAKTPGQYARAAVRRGLPAGSVGTLTRAFEEIRYGDRPSSDDRVDAARGAYDDIDGGGDDE